jgi:hypothetical protein
MSYAQEMLELAAAPPLDVVRTAAAIDALLASEQACASCADLDLGEDEVADLADCIGLCQNCADVCNTTMRALSRPVHADHFVLHRLLRACVRMCALTAAECARHAAHLRHCAICAQACRACEKACSELLDDEALEELQKLAGG